MTAAPVPRENRQDNVDQVDPEAAGILGEYRLTLRYGDGKSPKQITAVDEWLLDTLRRKVGLQDAEHLWHGENILSDDSYDTFLEAVDGQPIELTVDIIGREPNS